jgi:hypothetical protein
MVSIDHMQGRRIRAYANRKEFNQFLSLGIGFIIEKTVIPQKTITSPQATLGTWYPTYEQYDSIMHRFQTNYPSLCQLTEIGKSIQGRSIYFLKVSSDVQQHLSKPVIMYSSNMHGNELAPYALLLRMINDILSNTNQSQIKFLLDSCELWICPLANPDGTYYGGNDSIFGAIRYNVNNVDLNRNFPDPAEGAHPDGNDWQPENIAVMNFLKKHPPVLSANFHSGAELVNYPWDTWPWGHPDSTWYAYISGQYADTVQRYGPPGFFTDVSASGISDGYDWYRVTGGRQDYVNYFMHGREVTLEFDEDKLAPESELDEYWNIHYRSLFNYLLQCKYGIRGRITDKESGKPLKAMITIPGHDNYQSFIYSDSTNGMFYRMLSPGMYNLQVVAPGYVTQSSENIVLNDTSTIRIDFQLTALDTLAPWYDLVLFPNPAREQIYLKSQFINGSSVSVKVLDIFGHVLKSFIFGNPVNEIPVDINDLTPGTYFLQFQTQTFTKTLRFIKL